MEFKKFSNTISAKFGKMAKNPLFVVDVDVNDMWNHYLDSFPEGTNEVVKERREYDCQCCKHFIRRIGHVVSVKNGKMDSIWDVDAEYPYDVVSAAMHEYVSNRPIKNVFMSSDAKIGNKTTHDLDEAGGVIKYNHYEIKTPRGCQVADIPTKQSWFSATAGVFRRGLDELSLVAIDEIMELIDRNAIYRGEQFKSDVEGFRKLMDKYRKLNSDTARNIFVWENIKSPSARFRNTVIGTLAIDLSEGMDIEAAVSKYEAKVAPANYQRSSSLISASMVKSAMKTIDELGLQDNLKRRLAHVDDVSVNNVLFADRSTRKMMRDAESLTDLLMTEVVKSPPKKSKGKVDDILIDDFIKDVLPNIKSLEVEVKNTHTPNMMSVIAPAVSTDKKLFQWDNGFSWSYANNMTDSTIKQKVRSAGGNVDAVLRSSLSWFNTDDLDIHVHDAQGRHIYYGNKCGCLDVDMNVNNSGAVRDAVENVSWMNPLTGTYKVSVNNYTKRENIDVGCEIEIESGGVTHTFSYNKAVRGTVSIVDFYFDKNGVVTIKKVYDGVQSGAKVNHREHWDITLDKFNKVDMMMLSPNHWDGQNIGNKHYFFILDKCLNPEPARGIYNEFLIPELRKHRKVFEILGDKTKCEVTDNQLSGVGFSSTKRNDMLVRLDGGRVMNLKF